MKVHVPDQPDGPGNVGSGGGVPGNTTPAVCVQDAGDSAPSKTTLWTLPPVG